MSVGILLQSGESLQISHCLGGSRTIHTCEHSMGQRRHGESSEFSWYHSRSQSEYGSEETLLNPSRGSQDFLNKPQS